MTKKEIYFKIQKIFDSIYPDADCSLDYTEAWDLLVATQLAAQCTDARVNLVTPALFERYPTPRDFANAEIGELEALIRSTGFFRNKAKNLKACGQVLCREFGGVVPDTMEELLRLPGVGRKTANLVLGDIFGKGGVVVDTHAGRIARRLGFTKNTDPTKVEFDLAKIIPEKSQTHFCHQLVWHGRAVCTARSPKCEECPVNGYCKKAGVAK
ncbi:MAG: endonuclease III [Clostridia bacterium]|nr:endonuclease III [Clostridia bacterium]